MITALCALLITSVVLWWFWDLQGYRTLIANSVPVFQVMAVQIIDVLSGFNLWGEIMGPTAAAYTILVISVLNGFLRFKTSTAVGEP